MPRSSARSRRPLLRRKGFWWPVGIVAGLVVGGVVAFTATPWPGAMLIRGIFENNAAKVKGALEKHSPEGVHRLANEHYRADDPDALLDVYYPSDVKDGEALPVVVWTHGGAWISGDKADAAPYFEILATKGYTVVAPNYSYGPEQRYPTAVFQLNDALAYLRDNAERLHIDPERVVLAGDSAGSQLGSQLATIVTNPSYAAELGIVPALSPQQLRGVVLTCGVFDMSTLDDLRGLLGWGFDIATWSYTGIKDYSNDPALTQMSTIDYVTEDFPPAFITGGNADGLTNIQSKPLAAKLQRLGVETTTLFYPEDYSPGLPHEYQFNLDDAAGQKALDEIVDFLGETAGTR